MVGFSADPDNFISNDGADIEGGSAFRLLHGNGAAHNAPILRICWDLKQPHRTGFPAGRLPHIFFHPDYTVGYGISPYRALLRFADFTAGQGLHLAPKMLN